MAKRSVEYNGIGEFVDIVKGDVKEASGIFGGILRVWGATS